MAGKEEHGSLRQLVMLYCSQETERGILVLRKNGFLLFI